MFTLSCKNDCIKVQCVKFCTTVRLSKFCDGGFHEMKWNWTLNVSYNFIVLVSLRETVQKCLYFLYFLYFIYLPFARQKL